MSGDDIFVFMCHHSKRSFYMPTRGLGINELEKDSYSDGKKNKSKG